MTQAQKQNRERFKAVQLEAKKLRKKNPKLSHIEAVKQAWAIDYSKKKKPAKKKIAEIGKVKKAAPKKKDPAKKAVKKAAPKKKSAIKKAVSTHKDTKSHNVNIKVVSGMSKNNIIKEYEKELQSIKHYTYQVEIFKNAIKNKKEKKYSIELVNQYRKNLKSYNDILKYHKSNLLRLKKLL